MKILFEKKLLSDLNKISSNKINLSGDKKLFSSGYANGYVKGFYRSYKITIGVFILLIISLLFNLI